MFYLSIAARRTANRVAFAILIGTYQLVNDIYVPAEVMPASIFARSRTDLQAQSVIGLQFSLDRESSWH